MGKEDWLHDPLCWGEWYAERTLYDTVRHHGDPAVEWVVLDNPILSSPHSRLPEWEKAKERAKKGRLAYHWPENVPWEEASVLVYRVERKPAR